MDLTVDQNTDSKRAPRNNANRRFSVPRIFRDIRWLGVGQRTRRSTHDNSLVISNSCSSQVEDDDAASETISALIECPICTLAQPSSAFPRFTNAQCRHLSCADCLRHYLTVEITESRTDLACPVCSVLLHPDDVRQFLGTDCALVGKYDEFTLRRALVVDPDVRWCPAPDCGYAVIASGCAGCPKLYCGRPGCGTMFCYHCKQAWHANQTCSTARAKRMSSVHSLSSIHHSVDSGIGAIATSDIKACPRCSALIVKMDDGSCNHMTCTVCAAEFCWLCMQEISDIHYLSPSGCTFWGKKPWSKKKKILLQLAMLVGGPIGISLIAIAAIPAIMIGFPVWVGRKLFRKLFMMKRHRRNLLVTSAVFSSVILGPLLSVLAVVIGVPLLLAYVYGVVPVSLCRSVGSCGLKTTAGGVRINFDDVDDSPPTSLALGPFQSASNIAIDPEFGQFSSSDVSSLRMAKSYGGESDGQLASVGVEHDSSCADSIGSGFQRKLTLDRILTRLEVHAEVSFNPAGSSRRSLGEGSSGSHRSSNGVKSRSAATVSFSDIISTSQDVGNGHIFTPQPSNMSLGSGSGLALGGRSASVADSGKGALGGRSASVTGSGQVALSSRSASVAGSGPSSFLPRSIVRAGTYRSASPPPLTKRSVSFVRDLGGTAVHHDGSDGDTVTVPPPCPTASWSYKRQCMSVGDSIDERVESTMAPDYLSVRSLASSACPQKLEACAAASDLVAMVEADFPDDAIPPANAAVRLVPSYQRGAAAAGGASSTSSNLADGNTSASTFLSNDDLQYSMDPGAVHGSDSKYVEVLTSDVHVI